jgi:mRNA interferase MazF
MTSGTVFEQGEILLVPFPFTDLSAIKQRPVLVLSSKKYNKEGDDIITCGITSNLRDKDYSLLVTNKELTKGKLPKDSRIKADKLFTLEKSIVKRRFGKVKSSVVKDVKKELLKVL